MYKIVFIILLTSVSLFSGEIILGYYPAWVHSRLPAEDIDFEKLTHVAHSFIWPEPDGSISSYSNMVYPELIYHAHEAGKKVIVAIGGWGQCEGFSPMVSDSASRGNFVSNILDYCLLHEYDGIDID